MLHDDPLCLQLNGSSWRPARDVTTNRLLRAPLQLADNTHVVLDEVLLQAGQLTALGVNNLKVNTHNSYDSSNQMQRQLASSNNQE